MPNSEKITGNQQKDPRERARIGDTPHSSQSRGRKDVHVVEGSFANESGGMGGKWRKYHADIVFLLEQATNKQIVELGFTPAEVADWRKEVADGMCPAVFGTFYDMQGRLHDIIKYWEAQQQRENKTNASGK